MQSVRSRRMFLVGLGFLLVSLVGLAAETGGPCRQQSTWFSPGRLRGCGTRVQRPRSPVGRVVLPGRPSQHAQWRPKHR